MPKGKPNKIPNQLEVKILTRFMSPEQLDMLLKRYSENKSIVKNAFIPKEEYFIPMEEYVSGNITASGFLRSLSLKPSAKESDNVTRAMSYVGKLMVWKRKMNFK